MLTPVQTQHAVSQIARRLEPIAELNERNIALLCHSARAHRSDAELELLGQDEYRWVVYLVEGSAELAGETIQSTHQRAYQPLLHHTKDIALLRRGAVILRFDRQQYQALMSKQIRDAMVVHEAHLEQRELKIFAQLRSALSERRMVMPALPTVVRKVRSALEKDACGASAEHFAAVVKHDPVLSWRLMQVVNSAAYRNNRPVLSMVQATERVGIQTLRKLALEFVGRDMLSDVAHPWIRGQLAQYYADTARLGRISYALAQWLAQRQLAVDAHSAQLGAVLYAIGTVPIVHMASESMHAFVDEAQLLSTLSKLRAPIGSWLLAQAELDAELVDLPLVVEQWQRTHTTESWGIADVVSTATMLDAQQRGAKVSLSHTPLGEKLLQMGWNADAMRQLLAA